jgi:4-amino-4-deoxy-L-arabinose transferase-like glycosyltransferase
MIAVWLTCWLGGLFSAEAGLIAGRLLLATLLLTAEATMATTDAVLLASIVAMQGVLLSLYRAAKENTPPPSGKRIMAGWAALAIGILVKGPVAPAMAAATIVALMIWDTPWRNKPQQSQAEPEPAKKQTAKKESAKKEAVKKEAAKEEEAPAPAPPAAPRHLPKPDFSWLRGTMPLKGLGLVILITAPWLIAIAIQSRGAFFQQSLGGDFAAKLAEGQEGHGQPPGYFLLLSAITFWPAILFVLPGIGLAVSRRAEPMIRFLIAWALSWWLVVELVPTKLPNYVLPAFPPLAILAALWLIAPKQKEAGWRRFLPYIAALQFLVGLAALLAASILLPQYYATAMPALADNWPLAAVIGVAGLAGLVALILFLNGLRLSALVASFVASAILVLTLTAWIGPRLDQLWISERLAALVAKDRQPSDPPPLLAGYQEPSLVFALGWDVGLTDGRGAADQGARAGGLALIDDQERPSFLARLAELEANATSLDDLSGFNYSRGKPTHVTLYRVAPLNPLPAPVSPR